MYNFFFLGKDPLEESSHVDRSADCMVLAVTHVISGHHLILDPMGRLPL